MKSFTYHLPIALGVFAILLLLVTDLAFTRDVRVLATLLAPTLWLAVELVLGKTPERK